MRTQARRSYELYQQLIAPALSAQQNWLPHATAVKPVPVGAEYVVAKLPSPHCVRFVSIQIQHLMRRTSIAARTQESEPVVVMPQPTDLPPAIALNSVADEGP